MQGKCACVEEVVQAQINAVMEGEKGVKSAGRSRSRISN